MRVEIPFAAGKGVVQVSIWVSSKPPGLVLCNVEPPQASKLRKITLRHALHVHCDLRKDITVKPGPNLFIALSKKCRKGPSSIPSRPRRAIGGPLKGTGTSRLTRQVSVVCFSKPLPTRMSVQEFGTHQQPLHYSVYSAREKEREREIFHIIINIYISYIRLYPLYDSNL